ncbi:hypothetical protein WJ542_03330 [Paraburkholderia sp. B3]|uniref:hypothetical protein n=1 Tax=Paraburkholderia sp. B3 TaxID=3134791 RepID=UPI0039819F83
MFDQVNFEKNPALADLGTRNRPGFRLFQQRDWMNLQELGGLLQGERLHASTPDFRAVMPMLTG